MIRVTITDDETFQSRTYECNAAIVSVGGITKTDAGHDGDADSIYCGPDDATEHGMRLINAMASFIRVRGMAAFAIAIKFGMKRATEPPHAHTGVRVDVSQRIN